VILVALGSNLFSDAYGSPEDICIAAIKTLEKRGVSITARSRWFRTAPVPVSDQPWFVNGVVATETLLKPAEVLGLLHDIEVEFGRTRKIRNEARILDLDLIAWHDVVMDGPDGPILPHPRLHERAFVLLPLADIDPHWRHPVSGVAVADLIAALPAGQQAEPME
jgi:2-amino-4-hydroxy-6-hydroxymethyldihydropteridine diphosphokinase